MSQLAEKPKRRWRLPRRLLPRFSMATMFVFATIVCIVLGLVVRVAERQKRAVEALRSLDVVTIYYDYELDEDLKLKQDAERPGPDWLRNLIGVDYFATVVYVELSGDTINHLLVQSEVYEVTVPGDVSRHLRDFSDLKSLNLSAAPITNRDIEHFASSTGLRKLDLSYTFLSDAGLSKLSHLTELRELNLSQTKTTKEGVVDLRRALPNCKIESDF